MKPDSLKMCFIVTKKRKNAVKVEKVGAPVSASIV